MVDNNYILDLVEKHGSPLYIYDTSVISEQINKLENAFKGISLKIHYACKANSNIDVLKHMITHGVNVDTVSIEEVKHCMDIGYKPHEILYTPSFPRVEDLLWALDQKVKVHISSIEYLPLLAEARDQLEIGIRINPEISKGDNHKVSTGHVDSKFGVPISHIDKLLIYADEHNIKISALHLHPGSDLSDWKQMIIAADKIFDIVPLFKDLKYIDLGSGYKVKFKKEDKEIDLKAYAEHIRTRFQSISKEVELLIEPGKFLVSESGLFIVKVEMIMAGFNKTFAGVNSGFNHFIRPMYYEAYHEIVNISNPTGKIVTYDIVGYLCEEDTFAYGREIEELRRGDFLAILNAGAYGYAMSSNYNLRVKPKEIVI